MAYYRQWSVRDKSALHITNKPYDQNMRFLRFRAIVDEVIKDNKNLIIAGDMNLDRHLPNDPYNRPDIRETLALQDEMLEDHNLTVINKNA